MKNISIEKLMLAMIGILLVGIGVAFNAAAALGNDPIGIVYDGIRSAAHLSPEQLGMASNIVNTVLVVIVFLLNRHYVNVGTWIYIIPYGIVVTLGGKLYQYLFTGQSILTQMMGAFLGCTLLYTGVALYIVADIGLDPFTGLVMVLKDKTGKEYRKVKICFDLTCIVLGLLLGGKLGIITIITALTAGPVIQFLSDAINNILKKKSKNNKCAV